MLRGSAVHVKRCFVCRSTGVATVGHWSYFSFARGRWWRVGICPKCRRELLMVIDAKRAEAK